MRLAAVGIILLLSATAYAKDVKDKTVLISTEDAEMNLAMLRAQATLNSFLKINANPPKGTSDFKLKVRITDAHGTEYMWVTPFTREGDHFVGILADVPEYVTRVSHGEKISFTRADISDWGYEQNGRQKGSFTACVIFKHLPPEEVRMYRQQYGFQC